MVTLPLETTGPERIARVLLFFRSLLSFDYFLTTTVFEFYKKKCKKEIGSTATNTHEVLNCHGGSFKGKGDNNADETAKSLLENWAKCYPLFFTARVWNQLAAGALASGRNDGPFGLQTGRR